jgi:putative aminopeptidase FrvX
MKDYEWDLLKQLCAIHAVSGREDLMTAFVRDHVRPLLDEVRVDNLGNVVGILKGSQYPEHRLMLQAHMDELGLIIRNITDDGYLQIERVGGIPEKSLPGQRVDILTDGGQIIPGYVGTKSHHITSPDEKYKVPAVHDMFIDVGLPSRDAVEKLGIQVGDPITYHPNYHLFGDGLICSKALDNRVGVFILIEVLKSLARKRPPSTIVFSFTVLEEFSIRGSLPTVTATKPNAILSVDITIATDTPIDRPLHPVAMRSGPAIKMMDFHGRGTLGGLFSAPKLRRFIERLAKQEQIPLQREVIVGVITDPAFQLYLDDKGYVIAGISIPHRYSHASIQMCHESDIAATIRLMEAAASSFTPDVDLTRG